MSRVQEAVGRRYREAALQMLEGPGSRCCDACGCDCGARGGAAGEGLRPAAAKGGSLPLTAYAELGLANPVSLGCGNPTLLADLKPGEVVLDLGSGGGLDVLLSARRVAPGGYAYGVDMTEEMLAVAHRRQAEAKVANATFLKGAIEAVPLPDASVDAVISNCVINLAADKGAVLREAFRLLRPGGRLAVADMVETRPLAPVVKRALDAWAGCVAGTIPVAEYRSLLEAAGFAEVAIDVLSGQPVASAHIKARKPA